MPPDEKAIRLMWTFFTKRAREAVFYAEQEASRKNQEAVGPEHLLLGLLNNDDLISYKMITDAGGSPDAICATLRATLTEHGPVPITEFYLSDSGKRAIDNAFAEAKRLDNHYIGTEHLLYGILALEIPAIQQAITPLNLTMEEWHERLVQLQG